MKLVKYQGIHPECIEGFPEDCERSRKGSLHLRPGRTLELTDDEYAHLKAQRPDLARGCVVLRSFEVASESEEPSSKSEEEGGSSDSPLSSEPDDSDEI